VDADTLELVDYDLAGAGTGTGHVFTPKVTYTNVTALGHDAEPDASNQVRLGDANVTTVKTAGAFVSTATGVSTLNAGLVINEGGLDSDTRIEGDTLPNLLNVDAGLDAIGINCSGADITHLLTLKAKTASNNVLRLMGKEGTYLYGARLSFGDGNFCYLEENPDDTLYLYAYEKVRIDGRVGVGFGKNAGTGILFDVLGAANFDAGVKVGGALTFGASGTMLLPTTSGSADTQIWIDPGSGALMYYWNGGEHTVYAP